MSTRTKILLGTVLVCTMIISLAGGGLLGGAAGYYFATRRAPVVSATTTTAANQAQQVSAIAPAATNTTIAAVHSVAPAVVTVINTLDPQATPNEFQTLPLPFGQGQQTPSEAVKASGSGVIIDKKGEIVTNNHVVEHNRSLEVIFADGTRHAATLVGADAVSDLAVIKVSDAVPAVAALGDSTQLQPGETVIAIGSPLGDFKNSVTQGIVSAVNRNVDGQEGLIQTDAAINHGNSGGPLVNDKGQVIGINTLVVRGTGSTSDQAEGLGFAIPSATIKTITQQLIASGKVERPYLGVQYTLLDPDNAAQLQVKQTQGALVRDVEAQGPSAAGLRQGDVITAIDGITIDQDHSLSSLVMAHHIGDTVKLTIQRDNNEQTVTVKLGQRPDTM